MDNGKVNHWQALREERRQAYLSFLFAVEEFHFQASKFPGYFLLSPSGRVVNKAIRMVGDQLEELYKECDRVGIAGPAELADLVDVIREKAGKIFGRLDDGWHGESQLSRPAGEYVVMLYELDGEREEFVARARSLLETKLNIEGKL